MPLARLRMQAVRCLRDVDMRLHPASNRVFGGNGAGKTSLLEGVFLLGRGRSFRTRQTARLVAKGSDELAVSAQTVAGDRIGVAFGDGKLQCKVNGEPVQGMAELANALLVNVIDPSAHELIEGGPSVRRRYLDGSVFHVEHGYLVDWRAYRRALGQRNAALKAGARESELGIWTRQLVDIGRVIDAKRSERVADLGERFARIGRNLLGREVALEYRSGWRHSEALEDALARTTERDRAMGYTQIGPHRADVVVRMDGEPARETASRGQQKLLAAAFVLAEVGSLSELLGHGGVLLVDDPAAELDEGALGRLLAELAGLRVQLLVTAICEQLLPPVEDAAVFHVEQGRVKAVV